MAEVALAVVGTIASVGGAVVNAQANMQAAAYQQAVAERNALIIEQNAEVARRNAAIAEENARRAVEHSQIEQRDWSEGARQEFGQLMASIASSGVMVEGGTAQLLRSGTRDLIRRDAERIRLAGDEEARGFRQQAADFQAQEYNLLAQRDIQLLDASQAKRERRFSLFGGLLDVAGTFVSGATQVRKAMA